MSVNAFPTAFYCQKVLPAAFDDSLSYYEMVCKLTDKINELIKAYNTQTETYATIEMLMISQNEQDSKWGEALHTSITELRNYTKGEIERLEKIIADIVAGQITVFDPTYGIKPRSVDKVIRNIYHWTRYYADYAKVIDDQELTAQARDAYRVTAKSFDLFSMRFYSLNEQPQPFN